MFINIFNYIDRGIIPGALQEFNSFISGAINTDTPDIYLGLLQSSFIVGFVLASIVFGHLVHYRGPFHLCSIGIGIWLLAVILSGCASYSNSYIFLLFARMLSGVGEASYQCTIPPWIQTFAPPASRGTWMAIFYTAISVGTAVGYTYGAYVAGSIGWQWAFFIEGIAIAPFLLLLSYISPEYPVHCCNASASSSPSKLHSSMSIQSDSRDSFALNSTTSASAPLPSIPSSSSMSSVVADTSHEIPTMIEELCIIFKSPVYVMVTTGYAAQTFTLIGISTFGSAFFMGLGFFDSEASSSTIFGALVSLAGIIGTPLGGYCLDWLSSKPQASATPTFAEALLMEYDDDEEDVDVVSHEKNQTDDFGGGSGRTNSKKGSKDNKDDNKWRLLGPKHSRSKQPKNDSLMLETSTKLITIATVLGSFCFCIIYFIDNKYFYFSVVFLGCMLTFFCNSGINFAILLSVPSQNRAFAVAMSSVCIHVFGDVPSPIITGLIKDHLAPGCAASSSSEGDNSGGRA